MEINLFIYMIKSKVDIGYAQSYFATRGLAVKYAQDGIRMNVGQDVRLQDLMLDGTVEINKYPLIT
jgi:hypothetical protein